ncbi:MAG: hypothetical protein KDN05_05125, partial [Verrucomicrobiae bacterium]|nr:hypothetical protein [Verrucomicrobiae bacterium]
MNKRCFSRVLAIATVLTSFAPSLPAEGASAVEPSQEAEYAQTLNGRWAFRYFAGHETGSAERFFDPGFDPTGWKSITVPSNWELEGFARPRYALELEDGTGLYRRSISVPSRWLAGGRRVFLRFEGVAMGFEAWVNGAKAGTSTSSAYNPHAFDVTGALKPGADNVIAVKVTTRPLGYEFDVNDDWSLSGIFRDVTLFSVPANHLTNLTTGTKLAADGTAEFSVVVTANQLDRKIRGKLLAPDGGTVSEFDLSPGDVHGRHGALVKIPNPQLWTAETPSLYRLQVTLSQNGKPLQTAEARIGLREISIKDAVLLLNGRPIKLRGVNHHDLSPVNGRAITVDEMRRDLELMKMGNINFVRTSHYPPNERFIELCDEMGFYVMDEVPIGKGEEHLNNPKYRDNILARVEPTITRDKNHPSVLIWSIGNENPVTDVELEAARLAKELDPTRPICIPKIGSYFEKNYERIPDYVDIYAPHYPVNSTLKRFARKLERPLILTEYAHALGLATDRIQDQWEILQSIPTFAGGAIWHFHDQGILRRAHKPVDRSRPTPYVWTDADDYYDTSGDKGADGIVYSDRTPQSDYWQVRKVYAPVQIKERTLSVKPGDRQVSLTIVNRHDFRSLEGMKLAWSLRRNSEEIQSGEAHPSAKARTTETAEISVSIPANASGDVLALELRCLDETGARIIERSIPLDLEGATRGAWTSKLPTGETKLVENDSELLVDHPDWKLTINRTDGNLQIRNAAGRTVVSGIHPHAGRTFTMAEALDAKRAGTWRDASALKPVSCEVKATRDGETVRIEVAGTYPRPGTQAPKDHVDRSDDPLFAGQDKSVAKENEGETIIGGYQMEIAPNGTIHIRYDYEPRNATGRFAEAGLAVKLPTEATEFRWIGQGPFPGYPGKDRLNEFGIFHLTRDDLRFQGNRRETELALLTTPDGAGVALTCEPADVAVERHGSTTLLSHNAVISGLGNKGVSPETRIGAAKTRHIAGC